MDKENVGQEERGLIKEKTLGQAKSIFEEQRDEISGGLRSVAQVLQHSSHQLQQQDQRVVARCLDKISEKIEQSSNYLSEKEVSQLVNDIESFARRRPWLFLGSAFALGYFSIRLLRASRF